MSRIILVAVLLSVALAIFIARPVVPYGRKYNASAGEYEIKRARITKAGFVPLTLAILFVLLSSFTQIHAKEIGVGVSFGKPVAEYGVGPHFKPFWQSVTKINETVYTDTYGGNTKGAMSALPVRLGDGNPASVRTTIRWHVNPDAVDYIYATYRSNDPADQLRTSVVETQYEAVVNNVFSKFNPTAVIQDVDIKDNPLEATKQLNFSPDYSALATQIQGDMEDAVKDSAGIQQVIIDKVTVSGVSYSSATEKRITGIIQQVAKTQQAVLLEGTNTALSQANKNLSQSLAGPDGEKVLVQQCLQDLADGKFVAPAGFSCWPSSGSSVVVPSAR